MAAQDANDAAAPAGPATANTSARETSIVRDSSKAGGPSIPTIAGEGAFGTTTGEPSRHDRVDGELVVELELTAAADAAVVGLTNDTAGFLEGVGGALPPSGTSLGGILRRYGLQGAKSVFPPEQIEADRSRRAESALGAALTAESSALERLPSLGSYVRLRFPKDTPPAEVIAELKQVPEVARVVVVPGAAPPDEWIASNQLRPVPTDPLIGSGPGVITTDPGSGVESQWYLHRTRVPAAWNYARGANVVVADLDWGFQTTHRELRSAIEVRYNAVDGGEDVSHGPSAAHGTAVLGIAAARADGLGMAGYAPEADVWAIQANSAPTASVFTEPWAEAIEYVRRTSSRNRRKVIILEVQTANFGNYEQIPSVARAVRGAIADGCVVCVAAGNGNRPADRTDVIGDFFEPTGSILVGATSYDPVINKRARFSNFGSRIVVSAPGDLDHDVTCGHSADDSYRNGFGGTSGATPKVAGTAALMLSVNPALSHEDVRDILAGTGSSLTEDFGKPIGVFLNAEAAVAEALQRRLDAEAATLPALQRGGPVPVGTTPHGVHRRKSRKVLPPQREDFLSSGDYPPETFMDMPEDQLKAAAGEQPPAGDKLLRVFRETMEGTLTQQDRLLIVSQAIRMLDSFYVHRQLKESIHAVRPIQRLRVLQRRLVQAVTNQAGVQDELAFHNSLTQIFNSVRDLHTSYQLPLPYSSHVAYLPFEVAPFYEDNHRRYLVTRVVPGYEFADSAFGPGAELLYWSGMPIERAVSSNAEQTAGSNEAARHARGVSALTIRSMDTALPPDADFVDLEFLAPGATDGPAERRRMRQ
jgi:subtilisin family serine protease